MTDRRTLKLQQQDNVATAMEDIAAGETAGVYDLAGALLERLPAGQDIPAGHKIALGAMQPGELDYKYGQVIGRVSQPIARGDWVHTHNLESRRGRGDLCAAESV